MKKILTQLGVVGLISLFLMGFTNISIADSSNVFSDNSYLVAEMEDGSMDADAAASEEAAEEATLDSGDTAWMIVYNLSNCHGHSRVSLILWRLSQSQEYAICFHASVCHRLTHVCAVDFLWLQFSIWRWRRLECIHRWLRICFLKRNYS